jgi:putative phage-type endonuclease
MSALPNRDAFLAERSTGIGGSDAAAVVGLNPYKTNFQLWEEKCGLREPDDLSDNQAVKWGSRLEDVVADAFAEESGLTVHRVNQTLRSADHPFMLAHLDRRIVGQKRGLEVKTAGHWAAQSDQWGETGTDQVPEQYLLQCVHYMAVTGYDAFHLAVLIAGNDLRVYTIPRDQTLIDALIIREAEFWKLVQTRTAPSVVDLADARRAFPVSRDREIEASTEIATTDLELRRVEADLKQLESRQEELKGQICGFMGEADTLVRAGRRLRTWRSQDRTALNQTRLKTEDPDLFARYSETTSLRVLRACKIKE